MTLIQRMQQELTSALKSRDELRLSVFRLLSSAVHNREIETKLARGTSELSETEIVNVIRSELKKRREAAAAFRSGGRDESARREEAEAAILAELLPVEASDADILEAVERAARELGVTGEREFGRLMGVAMKALGGRASGERVSAIVRAVLSGDAR